MKPKLRLSVISVILAIAIIAALEALPKPHALAGVPEAYATLRSAPIYPPGIANRYVEMQQLYIAAANRQKAESAAN